MNQNPPQQIVQCPHCNVELDVSGLQPNSPTACGSCRGEFLTPERPVVVMVNVTANPYDSPVSGAFENEARKPKPRSHRGVLILTLGLVGFFSGLGIVFGPMAWAMGKRDLALMRRGRMDRSGRDMTSIGYYLGIATTILGIIAIAALIGYMVIMMNFFNSVQETFLTPIVS
jgi:hypothetical protein